MQPQPLGREDGFFFKFYFIFFSIERLCILRIRAGFLHKQQRVEGMGTAEEACC